jgi:hypothetical protein
MKLEAPRPAARVEQATTPGYSNSTSTELGCLTRLTLVVGWLILLNHQIFAGETAQLYYRDGTGKELSALSQKSGQEDRTLVIDRPAALPHSAEWWVEDLIFEPRGCLYLLDHYLTINVSGQIRLEGHAKGRSQQGSAVGLPVPDS